MKAKALLKIVPLYPGRTPGLESVTIYPPIWSFWPAFWPATRQVFKAKLAEPRTRQVWPASKDGERSWTRATVAGEELNPTAGGHKRKSLDAADAGLPFQFPKMFRASFHFSVGADY